LDNLLPCRINNQISILSKKVCIIQYISLSRCIHTHTYDLDLDKDTISKLRSLYYFAQLILFVYALLYLEIRVADPDADIFLPNQDNI
jgi:hypothetical protein